jgi:O-antigen ligase
MTLIAILSLIPLPFGGARPVWQSLLVLSISVMTIAWCWSWITRSVILANTRAVDVRSEATLFLLLIAVCFVSLNLNIIPEIAQPIAISDGEYFPVNAPLSLLLMISYGFLYILAYDIADSSSRRLLLLSIEVITAIYCLYGIVAFHIFPNTILWFEKWASLDGVSATFVNKNNFASFAGIGLIVSLSQLLKSLLMPGGFRRSWERGPTTAFRWLSVLLVSYSILMSGSRGGIIGSYLGISVFFCTVLVCRPTKKTMQLLGGALCVSLALLFAFGDNFFERLLFEHHYREYRPVIYSITLDMIMDSWLFGYGLGSFPEIFSIYRTPEVLPYFVRAHSDVLELVQSGGVAALVPALGIVLIYCSRLIQSCMVLRKHRNSYERTNIIAMGAGVVVQIGVQSCIDFPLQIPAVSIIFIVVLAITSRVMINVCAALPPGRQA